MSFFTWYILSLLAVMITADDINQPPRNTSADKTSAEDLVILVSNLSKMLEEQQKAMLEFHSNVVKKLEEQTEMLTVLLKKGKGKVSKEASKDLLKITTLAPLASPSNLVSLHPTVLPSNSNWSYSDPSTWVTDYPGCGKDNQSPVDLHTVDVALKDHKTPISFSSFDLVNKDTCLVVNNGNTVTINMKKNANSSYPILSGGPFNSTEYFFIQAVFHWGDDDTKGSEHTIRGTTYPLEMQLIHQTSSRGESELAITSFLFEESEDENPFLAGVITAISKVKTAGSEAEIAELKLAAIENNNTKAEEKRKGVKDEFSMDLLIKDSISGPYFSYPGSLTYPPCTEVKQYVVFRDPIDISSTQLEQFRLLLQQDGTRIADNFRQVQTLGDRVLAFTVSSELISDIFNL